MVRTFLVRYRCIDHFEDSNGAKQSQFIHEGMKGQGTEERIPFKTCKNVQSSLKPDQVDPFTAPESHYERNVSSILKSSREDYLPTPPKKKMKKTPSSIINAIAQSPLLQPTQNPHQITTK